MVWTQNYDPCNNPLFSTLLAAVPTVLLLGLLATGRVPAALAAWLQSSVKAAASSKLSVVIEWTKRYGATLGAAGSAEEPKLREKVLV